MINGVLTLARAHSAGVDFGAGACGHDGAARAAPWRTFQIQLEYHCYRRHHRRRPIRSP